MPRSTLRTLEPHLGRAREVLAHLERGGLGGWPDKVRIIPAGPPLRPPKIDEQVLDVVYDALLHELRLTARYRPRGATEEKKYELNPLGLVFRDAVVTLVCSMWDYDDIRTLVLHRMTRARLLDPSTPRRVPPGFDLDAYIQQDKFAYPVSPHPLALRARFDRTVAQHLHESPLSEDQAVTDDGPEHSIVTATVSDTNELRWWLRGFGDNVEVLGPPGLREEFAGMVGKLGEVYRRRG